MKSTNVKLRGCKCLALLAKVIEEGRGQSIHFRLLKLNPGCVQRHSLPSATLSPLGLGLYWRPYPAGLMHTLWDRMGPDPVSSKLLDYPKAKA
jgi:hypothetical protein